MGERCLRKAEVGGSTPLPSTSTIRYLRSGHPHRSPKLSENCPSSHPTSDACVIGTTLGSVGRDAT